jgi:hypothetical protein
MRYSVVGGAAEASGGTTSFQAHKRGKCQDFPISSEFEERNGTSQRAVKTKSSSALIQKVSRDIKKLPEEPPRVHGSENQDIVWYLSLDILSSLSV